MPRVDWGIDASTVDDFDRDSQYKPYNGPIPANGVYKFRIKVLKHVAGTREKNPQLRIGLELVPRSKDETKLKGYFLMTFAPISENTQFRYVPFLDAIGVTGLEFKAKTITDEEGNIKQIGKWRNKGDQEILAEIKDTTDQNGNPRKDIGWMGEYDPDADEPDEDSDDETDDDEYDTDEDYEDGGEGDWE